MFNEHITYGAIILICSDISYVCEFNPPPLFENALKDKVKK